MITRTKTAANARFLIQMPRHPSPPELRRGTGALAKRAGQTMTQYAIHGALQQPAVESVIIGLKRIEQLDEAIAAAM